MPTPTSLNVIYDLAVRQFDFVDRAYDGLTSRAAAMVGWTSFVAAAATFIQDRIHGIAWCHMLFVVLTAILATTALACSLLAYLTGQIQAWPKATLAYEEFAGQPEEVTRLQMLANIEEAIRVNTDSVNAKSRRIRVAIWCLSGLTVTLLLSLFASFLLPRS